MISPFPLQEAQLDDPREKILLPPTDPNAEVIEILGYNLVYVNGACPRNYRVYKADSMIGVIFQHITHWSNGVDSLRYAKPVDAAVGLDEFLNVAKISATATEQTPTEEELLDKEFDALTSDDWERLKRYVPQARLFSCSVRKGVGVAAHFLNQTVLLSSTNITMLPIEILQEFNSCYQKIQAVAQDENWLLLIADKKIDPEAATHLADVLHYLSEAMGCVEEMVEVKFNQESES